MSPLSRQRGLHKIRVVSLHWSTVKCTKGASPPVKHLHPVLPNATENPLRKCAFLTLPLKGSFPNVMELHFSHALYSLPRQKLWTGEIHRESQQSYCQEDFSWISLTKEFLTSYPFRYSGRWPAYVTPCKCMGWLHVRYWYYVHIRSALPFLGDCITMGMFRPLSR